MATHSIRCTLGTSSNAVNCTDPRSLRHHIDVLRDRLPPEESTSVEIVHLAQQLGRMADQSPQSQPIDRRGTPKVLYASQDRASLAGSPRPP
jgi:hypothetical protein